MLPGSPQPHEIGAVYYFLGSRGLKGGTGQSHTIILLHKIFDGLTSANHVLASFVSFVW